MLEQLAGCLSILKLKPQKISYIIIDVWDYMAVGIDIQVHGFEN